ncbi:hypothetical protein SLH46_03825 [Draconibacterium sp. IB214405]|uniref:hypothetical protein n=1 Tax=Draconibacterium sp. IB214405 TaxID=3097352 RepID=UPI002A17EFF0|nr:hypothetical protein [Draconibacterium sp. IB214405]MDX8338300.1 hypothetical protein [Draconibacterium sp. IB214405]
MLRKYLILIVFCCSAVVTQAQGLQISLTGMVTFNETQLVISEAGEDIEGTITSNSGVQLSIESNNYWDMKNEKWRIYVHKSNVEWNDGIKLEVKREGNGENTDNKGGTNIHDGTSYAEISDTPNYFFRGMGLIANIPLAFQLKDLSLTMGANDFETDVVFTIYDD